MRWSQTLIPTQKEIPADAQILSHQLMIRAGLIRQLTAGAYDFLPLGLRSLQKAAAIVREEMNGIGCNEVLLPALQPLELWQRTGRDIGYGENLMKLTDRHGRKIVLGPTHEEVVTELVGAFINSYKQLPLSLYQIQTKFRDEYRPRFGLLRVREFIMKDAYSFHADLESLNKTYDDMYHAYERIFTRCGLPYVVVEAESGPIGGSASHEFMASCEAGEDTIVTSDKNNYAANVEKAETGPRAVSEVFVEWGQRAMRPRIAGLQAVPVPTGWAPKPLHEIATPGADTIEKLCADWPKFGGGKLRARDVLKTVVFAGHDYSPPPAWERIKHRFPGGHPVWIILAVVRGDHEVNVAKLQAKISADFGRQITMEVMNSDVTRELGITIGYVGPNWPLTLSDNQMMAMSRLVIDFDAAQSKFWVTGANKDGFHNIHFDWYRDFIETDDAKKHPDTIYVADIRNAAAGDPSPNGDGGKLQTSKGIEIGHVFKLGTKYSDALGANYLDDKGEKHPIIMGCYGIGVGRILIAAIESLHDDKGIIWPTAIAPFSVVITPIKYDGEVKDVADKLYAQLNAAGIDTLLDDRDARPGFKFADADLIGFPVRLTIGDRGLKEGKIELKRRSAAEAIMIPLDGFMDAVKLALEPAT